MEPGTPAVLRWGLPMPERPAMSLVGWALSHVTSAQSPQCLHNEIPIKTLDTKTWVSIPGWQHSALMLGGSCAPENDGSFVCGTLPDVVLGASSFSWFYFVLFHYNKTVILSIALSLAP